MTAMSWSTLHSAPIPGRMRDGTRLAEQMNMVYIMSLAKALTLAAHLVVGEPCVCPGADSHSDEELECRVVAVSRQAGIVIVVRSES